MLPRSAQAEEVLGWAEEVLGWAEEARERWAQSAQEAPEQVPARVVQPATAPARMGWDGVGGVGWGGGGGAG